MPGGAIGHRPRHEWNPPLGVGHSPRKLGEGGLAEAKVVAVVVVVGGGKEAAATAAAAALTTAIVVVVVGISSTDHCFRWGELQGGAQMSADRCPLSDFVFS